MAMNIESKKGIALGRIQHWCALAPMALPWNKGDFANATALVDGKAFDQDLCKKIDLPKELAEEWLSQVPYEEYLDLLIDRLSLESLYKERYPESSISVQVVMQDSKKSAPIWLSYTNESIGTATASKGEVSFEITSVDFQGRKLAVSLISSYTP